MMKHKQNTGCLRPGPVKPSPTAKDGKASVLRFNLRNVRVEPGHYVAVSGGTSELGNWNASGALVLGNGIQPQWVGDVNASGVVEYKYLIVDSSGNPVVWEVCVNIYHIPLTHCMGFRFTVYCMFPRSYISLISVSYFWLAFYTNVCILG